ncbi:PEP-CTERM sorting domain-containing protein [Roseibacillus persicicus]|uniref:PEP-CTERM sorting domain-containing protein n=1 Tax=Roseibacillus persicicus TaxID=454148 RepID=UPI00280E7423|nr:PEP-CTERM sorting domain-containing protein [Roseibacillus persicicus]MDQ8190528.1 PEP-CTERM sorting domain-containing protein [Roseibacillus persicicus]
MKKLTSNSLALVACTFVSQPLFGALTVYEGFEYTSGEGLSTQNGGVGFAGGEAWNVGTATGASVGSLTVASDSLSYGALQTTGGAAMGVRSGSSVAMFRDFGSTIGGSGSNVWMSFLIDVEGNTAGFSLYNGGSEATFSGGINSGYSHRLYNGGGDPMSSAISNSPAATIAPGAHLMVAQFDMSGGTPTFNLWVDPDVASLGTGAAPVGGTFSSVTSGTQNFSFDSIRIGMFSSDQTMVLDELRIGESWADVSPIPEPSTVLLVGLAGVGLARRKRV